MKVKFYIKRESDANYTDLESYFNGMKYSKCVGLEDWGKPKNIYTETYADADELRVHIPEDIKREATKITFTFIFFGENRQDTYNKFNKFIEGKKLLYYDTKRYKYAYMVLVDKTEPKEDIYKGSDPYISVDYSFQNLWGECFNLTLTGKNSASVGKSVSFEFRLNGDYITTDKKISLYIDGKFESEILAAYGFITYSPTQIGKKVAQIKYDHNGKTIVSNELTIFVE